MKKRDLKYEVIRVISMIFVLSIHQIETFTDKNSMIYHILATIILTGVPCFFMLSGKYAFNIDYGDKDYLKKFYKKKFINLIIPILIYMMIKEFHVMSYNLNKEITVYTYFRSLFVSIVNGFSYMEYWFIYILLANILIAPFIGKFITKATKQEALVFLAIPFAINMISTVLGFLGLEFKLPYAIAGHSIYFYLGYFLDKFSNTKKQKTTIYILGIISYISTLILLRYNTANMWECAPTFTFISIMIYIFIRDCIKMSKIEKIILFMGKYSLSVYMLHFIFIYTFNDIIPKEGINQFLYSLIIIILSYIASVITGFILENTIIKWLKKIVNKIFNNLEEIINKKKNQTRKEDCKMYDYLIVGSGLFGSIFAYEANKRGKKCRVIDKRPNIGGNIYTENVEGINVHKYGAHIFHTSNKEVWEYINNFAEFNRYTNSPVAVYKDELYNMPFNMNTFNKLWGVVTPKEAREKIEQEKAEAGITEPKNLEEQAISLVGKTIYEKLVKGYTEKQWGQRATELPSFIIKRLPVRFIYDNNYFNDIYQGIPMGGYTKIIEKMLEGIEVKLNCDFFENREELENIADKIIFTGPIDQYYNYQFGELEYRSLRFETEVLDEENYQGNAVVNYTEYEVPYTRIIEHKHFEFDTTSPKTVVTREYPDKWTLGKEPYYSINNDKNNSLYEKYAELAKNDNKVIFGGRLGQYKYFDMDKVIAEALTCVKNELN